MKFRRFIDRSFTTLVLLAFAISIIGCETMREAQERKQERIKDEMDAQVAPKPKPSANGSVGQIAPDFTLTDLNGNSVTLSSLKGQPILLNFWATW